jgi:Flp pilus assembly protein TadG
LLRFQRESSGASAIEFAMLAAPVIFLILATFEVGLVYWANYSLENGITEASRMIRTGQAQAQNFSAGKFHDEVCKYILPPLDCGKVMVDVRKYASFGASKNNLTSGVNADGTANGNLNYDPGVGGEVVVVRGFYVWDLMEKLPKGVALANMDNGDRLLIATSAFRNEPFKLP